MDVLLNSSTSASRVRLVTAGEAEAAIAALPAEQRWLAADFKGKPGQSARFPEGGEVDAWLGAGSGKDPFALGNASTILPAGD